MSKALNTTEVMGKSVFQMLDEQEPERGPVSLSKRTRWLWHVNLEGKPALAPGVRTHQLSLLFGMGKDWFERAMAAGDWATRLKKAGIV